MQQGAPHSDTKFVVGVGELIPGSKHFTWGDALWLPRWKIHAMPVPLQKKSIIELAQRMDDVEEILQEEFNSTSVTTSWLRPAVYNKLIGGAQSSWHCTGGARDFKVKGVPSGQVRDVLESHLEELNLSMEYKPGASWVHMDTKEGRSRRYFFP